MFNKFALLILIALLPALIPGPVEASPVMREFESLETLDAWCQEHLAVLYLDNTGSNLDCDDYAIRFQQKAYRDGYYMSLQVVKDGKLNDITVTGFKELHMGNLVLIGNDIYYIEPQPTHYGITFVCNRD